MTRKERAAGIQARLSREYPDPKCALVHKNAFELLCATILSAQCTDERVNMVTPVLFKRFPTAKAMAKADLEELQEIIRSTGFFRNKSKSLKGAAETIVGEFKGKVPDTMDELLRLPGVARKTANVVLGTWFGKNEGVVVDTHVTRLSRLMGLTRNRDPKKIEQDLMKVFPREEWTNLSHRLIHHGRRICTARLTRCPECVVGEAWCPAFDPEPFGKKGNKRGKKKAKKRK